MPDQRLGEEVGATVYADPQARLGEAELRDFLRGRLAKFKVPRYFRFADEALPRIASGKIFKRRIREEAVNELSLGS